MKELSPLQAATNLLHASRVDPTLREWAQTVVTALSEAERIKNDAAYVARLASGSSWPGGMAERVQQAADRVKTWAGGA